MRLILFALLLPVISYSQKIEENKIDEFTKHTIKRTTWEKLCGNTFFVQGFIVFTRVSKIDDFVYLNVKAMDGTVFSVRKGDELMLKTKSDSIFALLNPNHETTCTGCGAKGMPGSDQPGVNLSFSLNSEQIDFLKKNPIIKIRLYTSQGYIESAIDEKATTTIGKELSLIQ